MVPLVHLTKMFVQCTNTAIRHISNNIGCFCIYSLRAEKVHLASCCLRSLSAIIWDLKCRRNGINGTSSFTLERSVAKFHKMAEILLWCFPGHNSFHKLCERRETLGKTAFLLQYSLDAFLRRRVTVFWIFDKVTATSSKLR